MRPRVFPAEDAAAAAGRPPTRTRFNEAAGIPRGRRRRNLPNHRRHNLASMRPRVFPAEDSRRAAYAEDVMTASMRPRVFPAEDEARKMRDAAAGALQ